jgi:hypothetical protein
MTEVGEPQQEEATDTRPRAIFHLLGILKMAWEVGKTATDAAGAIITGRDILIRVGKKRCVNEECNRMIPGDSKYCPYCKHKQPKK